MAAKMITLTAEQMEQRIAFAVRSLSRKKFTEKQLKQYIVNGKVPGESKRTKSGYQLYLDEFRKDLSKEERAKVGQVAKDGAAAWKDMDEDEKAPFLEKAAKLREDALGDQPVKEKKPRGRPAKSKKVESDDESDDEDVEVKTPPKKAKKPASSRITITTFTAGPATATTSSCQGIRGIDFSRATPPIGSKVMSTVPMPNRLAARTWPYSCNVTQKYTPISCEMAYRTPKVPSPYALNAM